MAVASNSDCWAHARRKFFDAKDTDGRQAAEMLERGRTSWPSRLSQALIDDSTGTDRSCRRARRALLAGLAADADADLAAAGALLLLVRQVINDLDPRQVIGQLAPPVLVVVDPPGNQLLARLGFDRLVIHGI